MRSIGFSEAPTRISYRCEPAQASVFATWYVLAMPHRHLMDLPAPVDDVKLLCGEKLDGKRVREDLVTDEPGLATCIACLRGYALAQRWEVRRLEAQIERTKKKEPE